MTTNRLSKTHPMVLVSAIALTIFSLLGSAAITGLIPSAHSAREEALQSDIAEHSQINPPATPEFKTKVIPQSTNKVMPPTSTPKTTKCASCGTIVSIEKVKQDGEGTGLGAVAGGVAGGILGNQVGRGRGNTLMTILGVGGGAYAGHTIEEKMKATTAYIVKVRMDSGTYRTITLYTPPQHEVGDQVKVNSGQMVSA